jgi:hypothetical protein
VLQTHFFRSFFVVSRRLSVTRAVGLSLLTTVGVIMQQGTADASIATDMANTHNNIDVQAGTPGSHIEYLASKYGVDKKPVEPKPEPKKDCSADEALKSVAYKVDGKAVSGLRGNVTQGSKVEATFEVADKCDDVKLGMAAYTAPSATFNIDEIDKQKLVDKESGVFGADGKKHTLEVTAPSCYFQVDFFKGDVLDKLSKTKNYSTPTKNLIAADNGGTENCDVPPPKEPPPPPKEPPPPPPPPPVTEKPKDVCPANAADRIVKYSWTINGVSGFKSLAGNVKPGDTVTVNFTIAAGCEEKVYSLASYTAPSATFSPSTADQQVLFDSWSGKFGAGDHKMTVKIPGCFYQVDFVRGGVLEKLGPEGSKNFYGDRLIEADNGGAECVTPPPPPPPVEEEEPPPPPPAPPAPVVVQVPSTTVDAPQLAETGLDTTQLTLLGAGLLLMGAACERAARSRRRSSTAA